MTYGVMRLVELTLAALKIILLRMCYGPSTLAAHPIGFGPRLNIKIRSGGSVSIGKIISRNDLSIFCDGGKVIISSGVFFNNGCSLNCMSRIDIGENTLFGEGVRIYDHDHAISETGIPLKDSFLTDPIVIGSNCWVGSNVLILKGVRICDGVTIGAGSVVRKSIYEPGVYVAKQLTNLSQVG